MYRNEVESVLFTIREDDKRILAAERKISLAVRNVRLAQRLQEQANQEQFEIEEGILYGPGISRPRS